MGRLQAEAAAKAREATLQAQAAEDPLKEKYSDMPLVQSQTQSGRHWLELNDVNDDYDGKSVRSPSLSAMIIGHATGSETTKGFECFRKNTLGLWLFST
jgi:hypothetical protein